MGEKVRINFMTKLAICLSLVIAYACSSVITYAKDKETLYVGMFQSPILEGQRVEFYAITSNFVNPLFRVFINDGKKEYELTGKYVQGIKEDGYYRVILDNIFIKGKCSLKVWIKDENSINLYDDERHINNITVIEDKNYDRNLIVPIVAENANNKYENDNIQQLANISIINTSTSKNDGTIDEIVTKDHNLKDKVENEWKNEGNKIVEQALLNQDQIIVNEGRLQNTVGSRFIVKEIGLNIENNKSKLYKYKLHVYDVKNDKWVYDSEDYREVCEWVAKNPGIYLLDLWTITKDSMGKNKKYDSWRIIPIVIQEKSVIEVESLVTGHSPIYESDKISFYAKSRNADKVQYRAWVISAQTQEIIDVTNGYGNITNSNEYYKIDVNANLKPGDYFLWIWVRDVNSKKSYDNYLSYKFTCLKNNNKHEATIANDILFNDTDFRVGKEVIVQGIDDILGAEYKLNIYDIAEKTWTTINEKYSDEVKWTPKKSGEYLISLWVKYRNEDRVKISEEYDCIKLKVININDENYVGDKDNKKYTIVNDFEELYSAVEKGYKLLIYNEKVKETYLKSINIVNEIIKPEMTELERVIAVHDYIVKLAEYAQGQYLINKNDKDIYNAYGLLINNIAVCQGYADTFKMMLDLLKIENYLMQGIAAYPNGLQEHAWNLVKLDGEYYHIDSTWNDPIGNSKYKSNYKYFLMNDEDIKKDHKWDEGKYPKSDKNRYKYFRDVYEGVIDGGWIYYSSNADNYNLYKIRINGEDRVRLLNSSVVDVNLDKNWIYFSNYSFGGYLFKIRKDGLGLTKLNQDYSTNIIVKDKFILYQNVDDKKHYQILKDGSEKQLVDTSLYDKL